MSVMQENQLIHTPSIVNTKTTVQNIKHDHAKSKSSMKPPISKTGRKDRITVY